MTTSKFNKCTSCLWLSQTDLLSQCLPFSSVSTHRKSAVGRIHRTCTFLRFFYELERFQKCSKPWTKIRLFQKFWRTTETVKIFRRILIFTETVNVLTPRFTKAVKIFSRILNFMGSHENIFMNSKVSYENFCNYFCKFPNLQKRWKHLDEVQNL